MRRVSAIVVLLAILLSTAACSSKHTDSLACHTTSIASNAQPRSTSPAAALSWFLAHMAKSSGVPTSGYTQQARDATRVVFASKNQRIRLDVKDLGTAGRPHWAVVSSIRC